MTAYPQRVGAIRPSQLMFTFGVGSIVDLPNFSAVVGGLDDWAPGASAAHQRTLEEPRLLAAVRHDCGPQVQELKTPAWLPETRNPFDEWARLGVPVYPFPRWLRCTRCGFLGQFDSGMFKLEVLSPYRPDLTRFAHTICSKKGKGGSRAVPARLVVACVQGHLDEFPWMHFVHQGPPCPTPRLIAQESGSGSRSTDVFVRCEGCNLGRMLNHAFTDGQEGRLPACRGRHAHLRRFDDKECGLEAHPLLLGASNLWFPATRSALSLPSSGDPLEEMIEKLWEKVKDIPDPALSSVLEYSPEFAALKPFGEKAVQAIIQKRVEPDAVVPEGAPNLTLPEWHLFTQPQFAPSSADFKVRAVPPPVGFEKLIERT
ncbi:MAG TPA: DrmB family protein, partial [bacterium]|nr:DrmB family protein [bacterium]